MELPTAEIIEEISNKVPYNSQSQQLKIWVVQMKREIEELRVCRQKLIASNDDMRLRLIHAEAIVQGRMNISSR